MLDFVNIEMIYHAKALEMYTECFQNIKSFDIEEDIEVYIVYSMPESYACTCNCDTEENIFKN